MSTTPSTPTTPEQARESIHTKSAQLAELIANKNHNGYLPTNTEENTK